MFETKKTFVYFKNNIFDNNNNICEKNQFVDTKISFFYCLLSKK